MKRILLVSLLLLAVLMLSSGCMESGVYEPSYHIVVENQTDQTLTISRFGELVGDVTPKGRSLSTG